MNDRVERFRRNKDEFFKSDLHSPLHPDQKERFSHLDYFPVDDAFTFHLTLDRNNVSHEPIQLDTTSGTLQEFIPAGKINLAIEGNRVSLTLYRETGRGRYFLPFRDSTSGHETYGGGRYLDPQEAPDGTIAIDFNYAYNPYCAYNEDWTCPIPPDENRLDVPVRAGEKVFKLDEDA